MAIKSTYYAIIKSEIDCGITQRKQNCDFFLGSVNTKSKKTTYKQTNQRKELISNCKCTRAEWTV